MTEVILFKTKEDGAKYYETGEKTYVWKKKFLTPLAASIFATAYAKRIGEDTFLTICPPRKEN